MAAPGLPADFQWPALYHFPPFFTLQVAAAARAQQLKAWRELVQSYCVAARKTMIDVNDDADSPLFNNANLVFKDTPMPRRLRREDITVVLDDMAAHGLGVWLDDKHKSKFLLSGARSLTDWGDALHNWASEAGQFDDVFTLYSLHKGGQDVPKGAEFVGLDVRVMHRAVLALQARGKAVVIPGDDLNEVGVKFLDA